MHRSIWYARSLIKNEGIHQHSTCASFDRWLHCPSAIRLTQMLRRNGMITVKYNCKTNTEYGTSFNTRLATRSECWGIKPHRVFHMRTSASREDTRSVFGLASSLSYFLTRRIAMNMLSVLQGEIYVSSKVGSERTQRIFGFIRATTGG
jgi:hypothetical protein